jgi:hypothetical protein
MKTILLTPDEAVQYWHELAPLLQKSIDHGQQESTLTDYLRKVLNYQAQLWVFFDNDNCMKGCGLTQFLDYSTHKTLHIIACTGNNWDTWAKGYYDVEDFARKHGCKRVEMWGRKGWLRRLPKVIPGWEQAYVVMTKEIEPKESSDENEK